MTQAGIPVPPGYVILSSAFERFIQETDLVADIDSILHSVKHEEMHTVEKASEEIQALILEEEIPKDIETEIEQHFQKLKAKFVAVRSSATAEDSSEAAWAGQLESYLNTTQDTLLENVRKCWASLFTPRADFLLRVRGLSMIEAGILDGDLLAVHRTTEASNGQIVIARLGDEVTVKRFKQRGTMVELIAENREFKSIMVNTRKEPLVIEGIAVGLIRNGASL